MLQAKTFATRYSVLQICSNILVIEELEYEEPAVLPDPSDAIVSNEHKSSGVDVQFLAGEMESHRL